MWNPFKKKKIETNHKHLTREDAEALIAWHKKKIREYTCPAQQIETGLCVCIECPKKGVCHIERMTAASDCRQMWISSCSLLKALKGEFDEEKKGDECRISVGDTPTKLGSHISIDTGVLK